jgi:hypothetical protein
MPAESLSVGHHADDALRFHRINNLPEQVFNAYDEPVPECIFIPCFCRMSQ